MRRHLGPAYERTPAERTGLWITENTARLVIALIVIVVYVFLVNKTVDGLFNFLETNGHDELQGSFSSDSSGAEAVKVVGSIILVYVVCRNRTK